MRLRRFRLRPHGYSRWATDRSRPWELLQNTETRAENATQRKLNAIADALADLMDELGAEHPDLRSSRDELTAAVGVEHRESTK